MVFLGFQAWFFRMAARISTLNRSRDWWWARISGLTRGSNWLLGRISALNRGIVHPISPRLVPWVIKGLNLGSVRQNQDAEKRQLCRKTERWGWRKREGVWRKYDVCGENVKNAGEKYIYHEAVAQVVHARSQSLYQGIPDQMEVIFQLVQGFNCGIDHVHCNSVVVPVHGVLVNLLGNNVSHISYNTCIYIQYTNRYMHIHTDTDIIHTYVCMYEYVYACICMYLNVRGYIWMYLHESVLTQCCTSQPVMSHNALGMMWIPLVAALHFSYRVGLQSSVHVVPSRQNSLAEMLYPSANLSIFALIAWACLGGCSTGSCNLCLGQWQSLNDCAVSQQYVSASGWSMKKPVIKRRVLRQVPSAHCKILLPALSTFHHSRSALPGWGTGASGQCGGMQFHAGHTAVLAAFFLSKTGIMPTTS